MAGAAPELRRALSELSVRPARCRIVCNRTGRTADGDSMPELLAGQLTRPIEWVRTMRTLSAAGVDTFVTLGPGRVLRSLVRRTLGSCVTVLTSESWDDLQRTREALT
jgi:malonyl CoA-acyl carrier protein transacylase